MSLTENIQLFLCIKNLSTACFNNITNFWNNKIGEKASIDTINTLCQTDTAQLNAISLQLSRSQNSIDLEKNHLEKKFLKS